VRPRGSGDAGLHPRSSSSTGRFRAGRPAGLRGRAARATRSCPGPARRNRPARIPPGGMPSVGAGRRARDPRRLGYLQTIERVTDRWADLAEPLGQRTVAFCRDVHHERVGLSHGLPERGRRIDQAEQAGRVALGDQHRGDRQASPGGRPTRRPDGDGRYQAPAQPPSRVATLGGVVNGCSVPMRIGWSPVVMSALWAPPAHILQPKAGTAAPLGRPGLDPEAVAVCHHRASGHRRDRLAGKAEHGRLGGFGVDDQRPRSQRCWHDGRGRPPALRCCSAARTFTRSWT
jgi:hypothetical protein